MVPGEPTLHLIVGETTLAFGVLEDTPDPVALSLHARELQGRGVRRGVGQAVSDRPWRADLTADDEMPAAGLGFRAVPQPDPPVRDVDLQGTTGAVAQEAAGPVLGAEPADQMLHREGFCRGPLPGRVAPPWALRGGNMQARRLGPGGTSYPRTRARWWVGAPCRGLPCPAPFRPHEHSTVLAPSRTL